jgi:hypothetical protein
MKLMVGEIRGFYMPMTKKKKEYHDIYPCKKNVGRKNIEIDRRGRKGEKYVRRAPGIEMTRKEIQCFVTFLLF